ncbi:MAG: peptidoglycan-associated lipoprotein Pal [Pseudomonadota bacterium]
MKKVLIAAVLANLLAACASDKPKAPEQPAAAPAPQAAAPAAKPVVDPLNDPNNADLAKRSTYFPFDVSAVQAEDKAMLEAHGKYLKYRPHRKVRVEGNCDERGSNEYNLALGQRRADSVKKALLANGAKAEQVDTLSYGESKPKAEGHNEEAWKQNRRADLNYDAAKK